MISSTTERVVSLSVLTSEPELSELASTLPWLELSTDPSPSPSITLTFSARLVTPSDRDTSETAIGASVVVVVVVSGVVVSAVVVVDSVVVVVVVVVSTGRVSATVVVVVVGSVVVVVVVVSSGVVLGAVEAVAISTGAASCSTLPVRKIHSESYWKH